MHRSKIKFFSENQRPLHADSSKRRTKNINSFRMRTYNITEQRNDLSAWQYNFLSCDIPSPKPSPRAFSKGVAQKIKKCVSGLEKQIAKKEKQEEDVIKVEHSQFKANSNR